MFALLPSKAKTVSPFLKILFVGVSTEDTAFLTEGAPLDAVRRPSSATQDLHLGTEKFDALVIDVAHSESASIRKLKKSMDAAVFILANSAEVSRAIQLVKEGADGFLVRGITKPASFLKLAKLAKDRRSISES